MAVLRSCFAESALVSGLRRGQERSLPRPYIPLALGYSAYKLLQGLHPTDLSPQLLAPGRQAG